ncbi:coiled-coil domain-containing protein 78 [Lepus europaeus]|uniref:coiled-coil domain-containing protein 78 n=1 Tax=Lepus europaeus TaxID=9983 RepID=UPI002B482DEA|nr:coiled-coil domain-containing protein 78 [Lepus europaeus]
MPHSVVTTAAEQAGSRAFLRVMESSSTTGPPPGVPPRATDTVAPGAEGWPPGVPGGAPTWASPLQPEPPPDLQLGEEQWLQISKDLVGLEVRILGLREQHEAEVFQLRSEVLRLESRVLQLELHGDSAHQGRAGPEQPQGPGPCSPGTSREQAVSRGAAGTPPGLGALSVQPRLLGGPEQLQGAAGQALEQHGARQQALESRVAALGQQLQEAREEARAAGQHLATQAVVRPPPPQALRQAQAENARLQLQLKQQTEEHVARLQRCARQAVVGAGPEPEAVALRPFLEATLQDIRAAHRSREQQLARAARTFQKRLADLSHRHEELLATHRGSPSHLEPHKAPQAPSTAPGQRPLSRQWRKTFHALQNGGTRRGRESRVSPWAASQAFQTTAPSHRGMDAASWAQTYQKLWDFSHGTQAELERERAQLLGRAGVAEQQLSWLQEYVDQHLGRYKQEILRLRQLLGAGQPREAGAALGAELQGPGTRSRWPAWPAQSLPHGLPRREPPP